MDIFCRDEKLNLSSYYLKPASRSAARVCRRTCGRCSIAQRKWTSSCRSSRRFLPSNRQQIQNALDQVLETGKRTIGLLGFSFKAGTDDLRESPVVILAEALLGKGLSLKIYDKNVSLARLVGANKEYIEHQIPHLSSLLCNTIDQVIDGSEVIVVRQPGA